MTSLFINFAFYMAQLLFQIKNYITYILKAKGIYSLHSPFIFLFYHNVVVRKTYKKVSNFSKKVNLINNIYDYSDRFHIEYPPVDLLSLKSKEILNSQNTILIFDNLNCNKKVHQKWKNLINTPSNLILLDFYHIGVAVNNENFRQFYYVVCKT